MTKNKQSHKLLLKTCRSYKTFVYRVVLVCIYSEIFNGYLNLVLCIIFDFFILLSRESDGGAMHRTNPDSLTSCLCLRVFRLNFASDFFNLLLVKFHLAEIIVVKHLIQGRNKEDRTINLAIMAVVKTTLRTTRQRCRQREDHSFMVDEKKTCISIVNFFIEV